MPCLLRPNRLIAEMPGRRGCVGPRTVAFASVATSNLTEFNMGMRIGGSSSTASSQGSSGMTGLQQKQQGMKSMFDALKSGDLASAQKAYASLTDGKDAPAADSPLGKLGAALQTGDLAAAQTAAKAMRPAHAHGHGHHQDNSGSTATAATATSTNATSTTATTGTTSGAGSLIDLLA
jgi:hypothetical protein